MKIKYRIIWIFTKLSFIFTAIFYVLFLQKKKEDQEEELQKINETVEEQKKVIEQMEKSAEQNAAAREIEREGKKENEELFERVKNGDVSVAIDANNELLQQARARSHNRNKVCNGV